VGAHEAKAELLSAVARHFEGSVELKSPCDAVFAYLDDFAHFGEHMTRSSWMMAGSRMRYEFDATGGRAEGALVRLLGSFLGLRIQIEERVVERTQPFRKVWETVSPTEMWILKSYRMGFDLTPRGSGSSLRVFIDYALPDGWRGYVLGRLFASTYARWCVRAVIQGATRRFG